ncbi:MAG: NAD(+)/NADH kinase [Candidatus Eisenbacteria bacterium]
MAAMKLSVVVNRKKPGADDLAASLIAWAGRRGAEVYAVDGGSLETIDRARFDRSDFVISLGGDGTLLRAARIVGEREIPILGVNLGSLGFLTEIGVDGLDEALERLRGGRFHLEDRMNLAGTVADREGERRFRVLNDAVITRAGATRIGHFATYLGDGLISSYTADGLILSTPTGSTAYNLSAGGPIVNPSLRVIIMTPICPHTLGLRPLILPETENIRVECTEPDDELRLAVDGQDSFLLRSDAVIRVRAARRVTRLVRVGGPDFHEVLRRKLHWGKRE